jgi:hypothetical protein
MVARDLGWGVFDGKTGSTKEFSVVIGLFFGCYGSYINI